MITVKHDDILEPGLIGEIALQLHDKTKEAIINELKEEICFDVDFWSRVLEKSYEVNGDYYAEEFRKIIKMFFDSPFMSKAVIGYNPDPDHKYPKLKIDTSEDGYINIGTDDGYLYFYVE